MASPGDEVYFTVGGKPATGKVLSVGKHGCHVKDSFGTTRKLKHAHILGYKSRVTTAARVVDQGVDGAIIEDESGHRNYVHGYQPEEEPEAPVTTEQDGFAMLGKALVLFAKAGPLKNRAGLHLEDRTDKTGRHAKHWVKDPEAEKTPRQAAKPEEPRGSKQGHGTHNLEPGDRIKFEMDGAPGEGEIVAAGKDGATVKTGDGEKNVYWHEVREGPEKQAKQVKPESLFESFDLGGLTKEAAQPVSDEEELYAQSAEALSHLKSWLDEGSGICDQLGYETMKVSPDDADMTVPGGMLFIAGLKGKDRATEKVELDYGGDWSKLLDVVRCSIAVDDFDQLATTLDKLKSGGMKLAKLPKNRFANPTGEGYRDILMNVEFPNGIVGELQLHVKPMLIAKKEGHKHYEITRTMIGDHKDVPPEQWSPEENKTFWAAVNAQVEIYKDAWEKATGGKIIADNDEKVMRKSHSRVILLLKGGRAMKDEKSPMNTIKTLMKKYGEKPPVDWEDADNAAYWAAMKQMQASQPQKG